MRKPFVRRHRFTEEDLSAYLDGRLSAAESARLEEHLASCEPCRSQLGELRAVVEGLRALPPVPAPRSFALRPEEVRARPRPAAWAFGPAGAAAAALLLFVVLVGVDLGTPGREGTPEGAGIQVAPEMAYDTEQPALGAAPAPTPPPPPAVRAPATGEEKEEGISEPTAAAAPAEAPAPTAQPTPTEKEGRAGRWVLRGFEGGAGAVFLAALAALLWRRRRWRSASRN